jgi:L-aminopeptidase/D-esterase-like protein
MTGSITDVAGIEVGHHTRVSDGARTGVTVVLARSGAVAGVDVRGGGPGTRETEALSPTTLVEQVHAICLCGGSAFGLSAAHGVMEWCREHGLGVDLGRGPTEVVPVVPAAVIFDLGRGGEFTAWPTPQDGRAAVEDARTDQVCRGSIGAGTGAISGGLQGGIGTASRQVGRITVGALVVLNSSGSVVNPETGLPWVTGTDPALTALPEEIAALEAARLAPHGPAATERESTGPSPLNTVIGVVATSADLTVAEATKLAAVSHDGLARAVRPAHSMFDGDTIFAMATGQDPLVIDEQAEGAPRDRFGSPDTRPGNLNALLEAAAICFAEACTDALLAARQHESDPVGPPSYRGCAPSVFGPGDAHH